MEIVVVTTPGRSTVPAGRKATMEDGVITPVADDAIGAADYWVCPRVDEHRSAPPFEIGRCSECGAAVTFRDTPRVRAMTAPTARKVCQPCMEALSNTTR